MLFCAMIEPAVNAASRSFASVSPLEIKVTNLPLPVANAAAIFANLAFTQANASYNTANSAASFANGAFIQANTATDNIVIQPPSGKLVTIDSPIKLQSVSPPSGQFGYSSLYYSGTEGGGGTDQDGADLGQLLAAAHQFEMILDLKTDRPILPRVTHIKS